MSIAPIQPDRDRHCFAPCPQGVFCACQGRVIPLTCENCGRALGDSGMSRNVDGNCWGCVGEIHYNHGTGDEATLKKVRYEIAYGARDRNGVPV